VKQPYNTTIYNTALYLRLSRDDELQGESGSIQTQRSIITFYFFFNFLVDMVDKGEKCPKYQAFPRQLAVNRSVNQTVNRWIFRMAVPFAGLLLP
jgi:hypothetical protein